MCAKFWCVSPEEINACWKEYIKEVEGKEVVKPTKKATPKARTPAEPKAPVVLSEIDGDNLDGLKLAELRGLCKSENLKVAGTKQQLVERLTDFKNGVVEEKPQRSPKAKKPKKPTKPTPIPQVEIDVNENGNYIHKETGIVFSSDEEKVDGVKCRVAIGYENEEGDVEELTSDHIETCKRYNFRYRFPETF